MSKAMNQPTKSTPAETTHEQDRAVARRERNYPSLFTDPFDLMRNFSDEIDRVFAGFGFDRGFGSPRAGLSRLLGNEGAWAPQIETFERGGKLVVRADIPGVKKDDIKVEVLDNMLKIKGERKNESEEKNDKFYRSERTYGTFMRAIPLPDGVNAEKAHASFKDGVLEITMDAPKREEQKGRELEIK